MDNLETNALRIAELMGWKPDNRDNDVYNTFVENDRGFCVWLRQPKCEIIKSFSSETGLQRIVNECNRSVKYSMDKYCDDECVAIDEYSGLEFEAFLPPKYIFRYIDRNSKYLSNAENHTKFIEALQLACIKYLELK